MSSRGRANPVSTDGGSLSSRTSSDSGATWRVRPEARGAATPRRKEAL